MRSSAVTLRVYYVHIGNCKMIPLQLGLHDLVRVLGQLWVTNDLLRCDRVFRWMVGGATEWLF